MDEKTQPQLFEEPSQPETPEASLQKRKLQLLHAALTAIEPRERKRLTDEYTDLILQQYKDKL
jgi:hypothetical protein